MKAKMVSKIRLKLFKYLFIFWGLVILIVLMVATNKSKTFSYTLIEVKEMVNKTIEEKKKDLSDLLNCESHSLKLRIFQRSTFWVLENYVIAEKQFKCHESITLTTNADFRFLDNLTPLVTRWNGPISVAIYAPGDDFYTTIDSIAYLRNCETNLIRKLVTFHVFFDFVHTPQKINLPSVYQAYTDKYNCSKTAPFVKYKNHKSHKILHNLTYPINVARNVARDAAQTHYVFASDIELYMTPNFIEKFWRMLENNPHLLTNPHPNVFALPIYEVLGTEKVPDNKTELQNMLKRKKAFLFHEKLCLICHKVPNHKQWEKNNETEGLNVFTVGKRINDNKFWEAFYVGTKADPIFDERFTWEGQNNKMVQGYLMCIMDYDYLVLDNAFLIHRPGIKKGKEQVLKHLDEVLKTNELIQSQIRNELNALYGIRKVCSLGAEKNR